MNLTTRRAFFASATTLGVGAVAGNTLMFAEKQALAPPLDDPVTTELVRQLQAAVATLRDTGTGTAARETAALFRLVAAHAAASGLDRLQADVKKAIQRSGKAAVLAQEPNHAQHLKMQAEAKKFGLKDLQLSPDFAVRERALDRLVKNGVSGQFTAAARFFESVAVELDAHPRQQVALRDRQGCITAREMASDIAGTAASVCGYQALFPTPAGAAVCAFFLGMLAGAEATVVWMCWF